MLKTVWGYDEDDVVIYKGNAEVIYDPDMKEHLDKRLVDFGFNMCSFIEVEDLSDEPKVNLVFTVLVEYENSPTKPLCEVDDTSPIPAKPTPPPPPQVAEEEESVAPAEAVLGKRKRDDDEVDVSSLKISKKAKGEDAVVVIEDDGIILVD